MNFISLKVPQKRSMALNKNVLSFIEDLKSRKGSICVLGGTGFLGTALRDLLASTSVRVISTGRTSASLKFPNERHIRVTPDVKLESELMSEKVEILIDLAYSTIPSTSFADPVSDFNSNLALAISHLELARSLNVPRYLLVSSGGAVYGNAYNTKVSENCLPMPISPYGVTKIACEHYARIFDMVQSTSLVILRPSNVYGPGQRPFKGQGIVSTAIASAFLNRKLTIFGDGSHVRDYIYIEDFLNGLLHAISKGGHGGTYNIGSGVGTPVRVLLNDIEKLADADGLKLNIEWRDARSFDVRYNVLDIKRISSETGWRPECRLEEGLRKAWSWYRNNLQVFTVSRP